MNIDKEGPNVFLHIFTKNIFFIEYILLCLLALQFKCFD